MNINTSELIGRPLDWAVSEALGLDYWEPEIGDSEAEFSTDWAQGGPIIERECITTIPYGAASEAPKNPDYWEAVLFSKDEEVTQYGPTPLIAAMRCYVASKLGPVVDVPEF